MSAFGVGGMMEEGDDPVAGGRCEVGAQPLGHGTIGVIYQDSMTSTTKEKA